MNIYQALKAGASSQELLKKFKLDLSEAKAKLEQEKREAEKKKKAKQLLLQESRKRLAEAVVDYSLRILGEDLLKDPISPELVEDCLVEFEKNLDKNLTFLKNIN